PPGVTLGLEAVLSRVAEAAAADRPDLAPPRPHPGWGRATRHPPQASHGRWAARKLSSAPDACRFGAGSVTRDRAARRRAAGGGGACRRGRALAVAAARSGRLARRGRVRRR